LSLHSRPDRELMIAFRRTRIKGRAPAGLLKAGGGTMKWVAGMLALLAVVSGCVSLNKGSDQVALAAPDKETAKSPVLSSSLADQSAQPLAAGWSTLDRQRNGARRDADLLAEL